MKTLGIVLGVIAGLAILFYLVVRLGITGRINSWWRTPWHNAEVGGKSWSLHLLGWAFDVTKNAQNQSYLSGLKMFWPFGVVIPESDHIHYQIF